MWNIDSPICSCCFVRWEEIMSKLLGNVEGEVLHLDRDYQTLNVLREYDHERVEVTIKVMGNKRRDRQNRYYWAAVIPCVVAGFLGRGIRLIGTKEVAKKKAHEAMRIKFLMEEIEYDGGVFMLPKSTADLTDQEFYDYLQMIIEMLLHFYSTIVPPPRERI